MQKIKGFSKLNRTEKIAWLAKHFLTSNPLDIAREFSSYMHANAELQKVFDGISENTLTNFYLPYGVAPNFVINGRTYVVPMVIEESSVVAAASAGAKFWSERGGFHAEVISTTKVGHVHFLWRGDSDKLFDFFNTELKQILIADVKHLTENMENRGGGLKDIELIDCTHLEPEYFQLKATFETVDAMGANFINSCLEEFAGCLTEEVKENKNFSGAERDVEVVMSILSNYTPDCIVKAWVECKISDLGNFEEAELNSSQFSRKFKTAINIAKQDVYRATTHNKGIFNGVDAVILATGNDFRAIEACGHAYASRNGKYESLSDCKIENGKFIFTLEIPLSVGTVGGLTKLHPLAKRSLEILGNPGAKELMKIIACVGLAQNFSAVKALVTSGIQKGHMKMHLSNILRHFGASDIEIEKAFAYFHDRTVSFSNVREFLNTYRNNNLSPEKS
ncbi:MAG: hydroxymethylglutaryl-CoA reductase, degradative [Fimbriimonadaceae bacterium]|nr:hydroxymethylglutaryl-CoA reductase, degradative [Chitinophagales bacterium]